MHKQTESPVIKITETERNKNRKGTSQTQNP